MSICIHRLDLWYSNLVQNTADSLGHVRLTQSLSFDATIDHIRLVKTCLLSFLSMETVAIIETCPFFLILHRLAFLWICILTDVREYDTPTQYFYLTAHNISYTLYANIPYPCVLHTIDAVPDEFSCTVQNHGVTISLN